MLIEKCHELRERLLKNKEENFSIKRNVKIYCINTGIIVDSKLGVLKETKVFKNQISNQCQSISRKSYNGQHIWRSQNNTNVKESKKSVQIIIKHC